ncbi:metallophosphoesterase family protein [bacterium]|nr:metallophosphoesterase family protein [candidate division CSSED10-310 bacterium]
MKYFIFSDIHGNIEALNAVLAEFDRESETGELIPVCLGDIVGYGPNPRECIEVIRHRRIFSLAGNHDYAAIGKMDISFFNPYAKDAVLWTKSVLEDEDVEFLESLPIRKKMNTINLVHATPCNPEQWNYLVTLYDAQHNFECFNTQVTFVGHSHQPIFIVQKQSKDCWVHPHPILCFRNGWRYIINVGSVGQPRDGNPEASFVIYDEESKIVEIKRIPYDIVLTQKKMRDLSLPTYLINRLEMGR